MKKHLKRSEPRSSCVSKRRYFGFTLHVPHMALKWETDGCSIVVG